LKKSDNLSQIVQNPKTKNAYLEVAFYLSQQHQKYELNFLAQPAKILPTNSYIWFENCSASNSSLLDT